ncbi:MAG TPA: hypothetical protein VFE25_14620, partial [Opitutaceae bacterium]|nr:hypothetical protein [Opitutaceae bacterium]
MTPSAARICIITPGHLASAPRVVKEANALTEAGFQVHVVSGRSFAPVDAADEEIISASKWTSTRIDGNGPGSLLRKFRRKLARRKSASNPRLSVELAAWAIHADTGRLGRAAAKSDAHLYIGHCVPGLAAAAFAAGKRGCRYGFDAEDFHDAETLQVVNEPAILNAVRAIESAFLPGCSHLTAASPLIGEEYAKVYGVKPLPILNVFPRDHAPREPFIPAPISSQRPAVLYWFSQTIGPGRGIEAIVDIIRRMKTPAELQLRGFASESYVEQLT